MGYFTNTSPNNVRYDIDTQLDKDSITHVVKEAAVK